MVSAVSSARVPVSDEAQRLGASAARRREGAEALRSILGPLTSNGRREDMMSPCGAKQIDARSIALDVLIESARKERWPGLATALPDVASTVGTCAWKPRDSILCSSDVAWCDVAIDGVAWSDVP